MSDTTLAYRDFAPQQTRKRLIGDNEYEDFDAAVAAATKWLRAQSIEVINVETVVLPNLWDEGEDGTTDGGLTSQNHACYTTEWHQFVRVWYRRGLA